MPLEPEDGDQSPVASGQLPIVDPQSPIPDFELDLPHASAHPGTEKQFTKAELDAIREICYSDPEEFCKIFLPTKFPKRMPWVHKGLLAIITGRLDWLLEKCEMWELDKIVRHFTWKLDYDDPQATEFPIFKIALDSEGQPLKVDMERGKYTEIIMPRGFSKTTLVGLAAMLYKILYQENKFIVYVSETATAAEMQMGNVRFELATNPMIHLCFGNLKPSRGGDFKWTNGLFQTTSGIAVTARGRGGQIRGLNIGAQRPDCILFDDVEDKESVATDDQRQKTREWFYGDLMPALPAMDPEATIIGLGTVLHQEALLLVLKRDPEWTSVIFGAVDRDGDALWQDNMSLGQIEAKKQSYALGGMLASFYREYMSTIRGDEGRKFPGPFIIRPEWRGEVEHRSLACDPAISNKPGADNFALGCVGITTKGYFLVLDMFIEVGIPVHEQVNLFFEFSARNEVDKHGVETVAYQLALAQSIRAEMFRRKRYFVVEEIKHGRKELSKDERITGILQPLYSQGFIAHARPFPKLEAQLLDFPDGKRDGPDVLAMACKLLAPFLGNLAEDDAEGQTKDEVDEYEELEEWRSY